MIIRKVAGIFDGVSHFVMSLVTKPCRISQKFGSLGNNAYLCGRKLSHFLLLDVINSLFLRLIGRKEFS